MDLALKKPIRIQADPDRSTAKKLRQEILTIPETSEDPEDLREAYLVLLAKEIYRNKVIIFFKTKKKCHKVAVIF